MIPRALIFLAAVSLSIVAEDRKALENRAAKGESEAQYLLAEKLYWADGGQRDLKQSLDFARAAAKQGNAKAQYRLAVQMLLSQGVALSEDTIKEGQQMLDAAAKGLPALVKAGDADAAFKLALLYETGLDRFGEGRPYERRSKETVFALVEQAAKGGHVPAQLLISAIMQNQKHPKYSLTGSVDWLRKAAKQGNAHAAHKLWAISRHTQGTVVLREEGREQLAAAARSGLSIAQHEYGSELNRGTIGGVPDPKAGLEWVRKAAMQGFATAQFVLGLEYALGKSLERDINQSFIWLARARSGNLPPAIARRLDLEIARVRQDVAADKLLGLINEAKQFKPQPTAVTEWPEYGLNSAKPAFILQLRREMLSPLTQAGEPEAMFVLAECFAEQMEVHLGRSLFFKQNNVPDRARNEEELARECLKEVKAWYTKAAENKHLDACVSLAMIYHGGVDQLAAADPAQAGHWYHQGALLGDTLCMYRYASLIHEGQVKGVERKDLIPWLQKAADKNHAPALSMMGLFLIRGDLIAQDTKAAVKCFEKAALQNYAVAQGNLGQYHAEAKRYEEAIKWYRLAARQGEAPSQFALGLLTLRGQGTKKDLPKAYYWFTLAKKYGFQGVDRELESLAKQMSASDIRQADAEASRFVAQVFYKPDGSAPVANLAEVDLKTLQDKAEGGDREAQFQLGLRYAKGDGVNVDTVIAYQWLYIAEKTGHPAAESERKQMMKVYPMGITKIRAARDMVKAFRANK